MKKSRFPEALIIAILREAEGGVPIPDLCREHGISTATLYGWRSNEAAVDVGRTPADCRRERDCTGIGGRSSAWRSGEPGVPVATAGGFLGK